MNQSLSYEVAAVMAEVRATGLLVGLFTAQSRSTTLGDTGIPSGTAWSDVSGLVDIPCQFAVGKPANEANDTPEVTAMAGPHVLLDDYYSTLVDGWRAGWRCLVDDVAYNIVGAENDSQSQMTRVWVERVSV
jgi:hypothetical protein